VPWGWARAAGCWGREGAGALAPCPSQRAGVGRESLEGALGEALQFVTGVLGRPGMSSDLGRGIGFGKDLG